MTIPTNREEPLMSTPSVTPVQYGAGGVFLAIALGCLQSDITGTDLIAYLASAAVVTAALIVSDALIRRGRASIIASGGEDLL